MSRSVAETFDTRAAGWIHRVFLLEEEYRPLPADPSPAMLIARVSERLGLAAGAIDDVERVELSDIAVYFLGAAAFALTAVTRIDPDRVDAGAAQRKDALLESLDKDILGTMETERDLCEQASADEFLRLSLSALTTAYQAVAELEGVNALSGDEEDDGEEPPDVTVDELLLAVEQSWDEARSAEKEKDCEADQCGGDEWQDHLREQIVDSLWDTAVICAAAGEQLVERHEASASRAAS